MQRPAAAATVEEAGLLRPAALAALPDQLRRELLDAVLSLEPGRVGLVIDRVREVDGPLGSSLSWFRDRYNYTAILNAIRESELEPEHNKLCMSDERSN
jgi:hypothetical protein